MRVRLKKRRTLRKGGGGKKGASFERYVCKLLSKWVSCGKRVDCFWRSAMSGGRATLESRKGHKMAFGSQSGDITATHPDGNHLLKIFCVDAKHYRDFKVSMLFFGRTSSTLQREWKKTVRDADACAKEPMMICRQNGQPEFVVLSRYGLSMLREGGELPVFVHFPQAGLTIVKLDDMLALDYLRIRRRAK